MSHDVQGPVHRSIGIAGNSRAPASDLCPDMGDVETTEGTARVGAPQQERVSMASGRRLVSAPTRPRRPPVVGHGFVTGRRYTVLLVVTTIVLAISLFLAVSIGSVNIPIETVWRVVWDHMPWVGAETQPARQDAIIWEFRVPRALLAAVVGAALAVAGAALQAAVRNPLAEPYVLGVVQGASFGAVVTIGVGSAAVGGLWLSVAAFVGAMVALLVLLVLGRSRGKVEPVRLVLAGVAIGELFYAGTAYVQMRLADGNSLAGVLFWLLGTVAAASWDDLGIPTILLVVTTTWLMVQGRHLNALITGDESAIALGVDPARFRLRLLIVAALLTGTVVAVAGGIAFVGLVIPHIARLIVGADHRRLLPAAVLFGAVFMVLVDLGSRTLARPVELPLTIITAAVGAPFFLWLMQHRDRQPGVGQ